MRADLLGCSVDVLTMAETVERARVAMRDRGRVQHVALNVAKFVNMRSDQILRSDVIGSDVIGIDGMGIVLALRLFGVPVKERVAGIDLCWEVLSVCARDGFRPFLLGATPDVSAYRDRLDVPFIMGVGGSLDVIAGHVRRAPPIMRSMGLEWLYRVYQEPRRMWWRYVKTNTLFAGILIRGILNQYSVGPRWLSRSG